MPRGRHRHSPPLHRFLPPAAVALAAVVCAGAVWWVPDLLVVRVLAGCAAVAAVAGGVMARLWDRAAGRRVADLDRARTRDEWRVEERVAELEAEAEEERELRVALETKLRAKRSELARMRSEHAELLRRYATAETKRANALEGRRRLELEAAVPTGAPRAVAGVTVPAAGTRPVTSEAAAASSLRAASGVPALSRSVPAQAGAVASPAGGGTVALTPEAYRQAAQALHHFARNASRQAWDREAGQDRRVGDDRRVGNDRPAGAGRPAEADRQAEAEGDRRARTAGGGAATRAGERAERGRAVAALAPRRAASREVGGFDFFGTGADSSGPTAAARTEPAAHPERSGKPAGREPGSDLPRGLAEDLADVVGDEAVADRAARSTDDRPAARPAPGEVIDLTAHDETERLELGGLRNSASG